MTRVKPEYRVGIGASSILMIFVVLCLTTLGVLSYASARADLALTERRAERVMAYYEAAAGAQRQLTQIDAALRACEGDFTAFDAATEGLGLERDGDEIAFQMEMGGDQRLEIAIKVDFSAFPMYDMLYHRVVNMEEWVIDDTLNLL